MRKLSIAFVVVIVVSIVMLTYSAARAQTHSGGDAGHESARFSIGALPEGFRDRASSVRDSANAVHPGWTDDRSMRQSEISGGDLRPRPANANRLRGMASGRV